MFTIIGIVVVFGAIVAGYLMEHGKLLVLYQPAELVIIGGAALGTILIANPMKVVVSMIKGMLGTLKGSKYSKAFYLENIKMLGEIFNQARKNGLVKLEADVDAPEKSQLFMKYPNFVKDHTACQFLCDTIRLSMSGGVTPFELDQLMEVDADVHHKESHEPIGALTTMADALPGLGIVAAVLGVVITMGSIGGPPEEVGHKVAAALVGTFLGILLCYGLFSPLAANMAKESDAESQYLNFLRAAVIAFLKGSPPVLALEFGRRTIPHSVRPSFQELEKACKGGGGPTEAAAA